MLVSGTALAAGSSRLIFTGKIDYGCAEAHNSINKSSAFRLQRFNLGSARFVPLLQVGSETVHFPNESPAELKQCLATLEMSAADRTRLNS
jgi:hypothetical protein